jgi:DNA-binding GntR family transcriptional regulator
MQPSGEWGSESAAYVLPATDGGPDAWTEETRRRGQTGSQVLTEVVEVPAPPSVAQALRLAKDSSVVLRRRLVLLDGRPVELADSYYPTTVAAGTGLAEPKKIRGGAPTLLAALGYVPAKVVEQITVRPPTAAEAEALELAEGAAVVELFRVTAGRDDAPYEVSVMTMRPEGRVFRYQFRIGGDGA